LPPEVLCAQAERESGWDPYAVRFEPAFLSRYVAPLYTAGEISATEAYTRSMSWGLVQIMGQTAREFGFAGKFLAELSDPATGLEYGARKLAACLRRAKGDMKVALLAFNGGDQEAYPSEVLALAAPYRLA
jgi:soluble lytic murein transglycosylase-like protein